MQQSSRYDSIRLTTRREFLSGLQIEVGETSCSKRDTFQPSFPLLVSYSLRRGDIFADFNGVNANRCTRVNFGEKYIRSPRRLKDSPRKRKKGIDSYN